MALKTVCLLLLWGLTLFFYGVTSLCNVTCSTDYETILNCSCSDSVPIHPVPLEVSCRYGEIMVNGSCEVKSPMSWCLMNLTDILDEVASVETKCTARVSQHGSQEIIQASESSTWALSDVVKPQAPFSVCVTSADGFYNITWDSNNIVDCLQYSVRIRESKDLSKDPVYSISVEKNHFLLLNHDKLQQHSKYTVDVQAKMCPGNIYQGPWSERSSAVEWITTGPSVETEGMIGYWWYVPLSIILVLGILLLGCTQKTFWQKKLQLITYVPKPNDFFKPLYHNYGGNFKEWVKPVFSEYDYLRINSLVPMMSEKQHDILHWNNEKQSYSDDSETKQGGHFLHMLQPPSHLLLNLQDGGSSQGTGHSTGHISIHTVTLSGEEFDEDVMSESSINTLRSYQDGGSFGSFEEDNREHAGYNLGEAQLSRMERQSGISPQHENQIANNLSVENLNFQPRPHFNEPERVSLDSFVSNEQSEDGYPHVDLDTIDSGFVECSSPGVSHSNTTEQMDSDLFHEHKTSNSNYVKQWMICSTIQEDSNSENELHESQ